MNGVLLASLVIVVGVLVASYFYFTDQSPTGNIIKQALDSVEIPATSETPKQTAATAEPTKQGLKDLCKDVVCKNSTKVCQDGFVASCKNSCSNSTCSSCKPNCSGHDKTPVVVLTTITPTPNQCAESWSCSDWSACSNNQQTRTCADSNNCGTTKNKPSESQACSQPSATTQTNQPKIINIKFDADGDDRKKETWNTEWVEIDGQGVDMSDWILSDLANHTFTFPEGFVISGQIKIKSGDGTNTQAELYFGDGPIWNNDGDTAFMKDKNGNLIDQYTYG